MSLQTTYNLAFGDFRPKSPPATVQGEARVKAEARNKQTLLESLFGVKPGAEIKPADVEGLKDYLSTYSTSPALGQYLFGAGFAIKPQDQDILTKFKANNNGYFNTENPQHQALYKACYYMCVYRAKLIEKDGNMNEVAARAYKMMALFSPEPLTDNPQDIFKNADAFITKHLSNKNLDNPDRSDRPLHDIGINKMPDYDPANPQFNLPAWKAALDKCGMELVKSFGDIVEVEGVIKKERGIEGSLTNENVPKDKKGFEEAFKKVVYERYDENPEFGDLFRHYKAPKGMFNTALDKMKDGHLQTDEGHKKLLAKTKDHIPDVAVKLSDDMHMVKLPSNDPRALILGQITNCCQSIDGHSADCVRDGVNLANNGFYVIVKAAKGKAFDPTKWSMDDFEKQGHKIVGQSYAWRGKGGGLTLDSLEVLRDFRNEMNVADVMQKFGDAVCEKDLTVSRVMLGIGGGTAAVMEAEVNKVHGLTKSEHPASMQEGVHYYDSDNQYEAYVSSRLLEGRQNIVSKFADLNLDPARITSFVQVELLSDLDVADIRAIPQKWLSSNVMRCFNDKKSLLEMYNSLKGIAGTAKCDWLISDTALECYQRGYFTFDDLKGFDADKIRSLSSAEAVRGYKKGLFAFADLRDFTGFKIRALIGDNAIQCYEKGLFTFSDLKGFDAFKIVGLTNADAMQSYEKGYFTFADLKDFDGRKVRGLTNAAAVHGYETGLFTFSDLKDLFVNLEGVDAQNTIKLTNNVSKFKAGMSFQDYASAVGVDLPQSKNSHQDKVVQVMELAKDIGAKLASHIPKPDFPAPKTVEEIRAHTAEHIAQPGEVEHALPHVPKVGEVTPHK